MHQCRCFLLFVLLRRCKLRVTARFRQFNDFTSDRRKPKPSLNDGTLATTVNAITLSADLDCHGNGANTRNCSKIVFCCVLRAAPRLERAECTRHREYCVRGLDIAQNSSPIRKLVLREEVTNTANCKRSEWNRGTATTSSATVGA